MSGAAPSLLFSVTNKNILITGGSRGIGYMIASAFVEHGANVLITSRDATACEEAATNLLALLPRPPAEAAGGVRVHHVPSNVSTREGCRALASHAREVFSGRLDVLVNNAGASWGEDPGFDFDGDGKSRESGRMNWGWDKVLDLNVKGLFYLTRECVPMLQRRRTANGLPSTSTLPAMNSLSILDPGRIINIGSVTGLVPQDAPTHAYDVSKAAVHHLTRKLAADLAPRGITVNAIAPGYVLTRMSKGLSTWTGADVDAGAGAGDTSNDVVNLPIPLGRMGNADDMGGACIYLSSRAGAYCTGTILTVDGGIIGAAKIQLSHL